MQEEIFGQILPVIPFDDFDGALAFINDREHPLALYLFSNNHERQDHVVHHLLYGGGCINDCVCHLANPNMPFGGVGYSGMGRYHGKDGFETFSHLKSILVKPAHPDIPLRYAPYKGKLKTAKKLM
jgi:aldehyde dehydrogenase (NAD+)